MTALQKALKKGVRRLSYFLIVFFAVMSIIGQDWLTNLGLVFFISLISTSRVSHVLTHWLIVPLMLCLNPAGSDAWIRWSLRWTPVFKVLFILAIAAYLFVSKIFWFVFVLIIIEEFSNYVISPKTNGSYGFQMLLKKLFIDYRNKVVFYGIMCLISFLFFLVFIYTLFHEYNVSGANPVFFYFILAYILLLILNWLFAFVTFVLTQFILVDRKSVILSDFVHWKIIFLCFLLFGSDSNILYSSVYLTAFFASLIVCEYLIETISVFFESRKSHVSQLRSSPGVKHDIWLYYFLIFFSLIVGKLLILFLLFIIVLASEFRRFLDFFVSFFESRSDLDGYWISNFNNDLYDLDVYKRLQNKFRINGYRAAIVFRWYYFKEKHFVSLVDILPTSKFVIMNIGVTFKGSNPEIYAPSADGNTFSGLDEYDNNYRQIKSVLLTSVGTPFRLLVILGCETIDVNYLNPLDGRRLESWSHNDLDSYFDKGCREFYEVEYLFEYLDEKPLLSENFIEEISLDVLRLNDEIKGVVLDHGIDIPNLYSNGLTPLLVLHRRTHEFSMVASRFMELLNLLEVAARWILIFEREFVIELKKEVQFSFGSVVSEIRNTEFAKSLLFVDDNELRRYKSILKNSFGYDQKENKNFQVIDFFNWIVFIRNKTRGHGSPSRVSKDLYELVEINTIRLLQKISEYYNPEILMFTERFYVVQKGMCFDFKYYDEDSLPSNTSKNFDAPFIKHSRKNTWHLSSELIIKKNNIYMLSAIKNGKCEWICYNTGE